MVVTLRWGCHYGGQFSFSHNLQEGIDFKTVSVNSILNVFPDLYIPGDQFMMTKVKIYWVVHPLRPQYLPQSARFFGPRDISQLLRMYNPIHPSSRQCTDKMSLTWSLWLMIMMMVFDNDILTSGCTDATCGGHTASRFSMPLTSLGAKKYYLGIFFKVQRRPQ